MRHRRSLTVFALIALATAGSVADAQGGAGRGETAAARRPVNRGLRAGGRAQLGDTGDVAGRQAIAAKIRQQFAAVVRRQLNLSDEKWRQFERVDRQFQKQRNQIQRDERQTRIALKTAMQDTANVDQAKIAQYLNELTQAQRRRADLLDAEQKELSGFLTPLQRAKLQALREQLNRRVLQMQQQAGAGRRGALP
jgi:Spy/CpxP family protein refolding chaperone